jgi:hypothetical protein
VGKADKFLDVRDVFEDGSLLVIRVWRVDDPVRSSLEVYRKTRAS